MNPQESLWKGKFGDAYIYRNSEYGVVASNTALFAKILSKTVGIASVLELGANVGLNLLAIKNLLPAVTVSGVEINLRAIANLKMNISNVDVWPVPLSEFKTNQKWDLVFTKALLIHIHPDHLYNAYNSLYRHSNKYIVVVEYYNPKPVEVVYRKLRKKLWKRDFAGEIMGMFPNVKLLDYGFVYRYDTAFPQDDMNWFLMEKI